MAFGSLGACGGDRGIDAYPNRRSAFAAPGHLVGYVANRSSDTVSVVDLDAMVPLGTAPVGRDPVDVDGPRHIILDPRAALAYVVLSYPESVVGAHEAAAGVTQRASYLQALALSDLRPLGELRLQARGDEMSLSSDGAHLAVTHDDTLLANQPVDLPQRRAALALVDGPSGMATGTPAVRWVTVCAAPTSIVYGAGATRAYVACAGEDALAVVDTTTATVRARVPAGDAVVNQPYALVADAGGEHLLLSNQVSRTAVLFTAADAPVLLARFALTGVPMFAAWISDDQILVPTQEPSGVALLDAAGGRVRREVFYADDVCENPGDAQRTADGRIFLVCEGDHYDTPGAVAELDADTLAVTARVPVGVYPDRLALLPPH